MSRILRAALGLGLLILGFRLACPHIGKVDERGELGATGQRREHAKYPVKNMTACGRLLDRACLAKKTDALVRIQERLRDLGLISRPKGLDLGVLSAALEEAEELFGLSADLLLAVGIVESGLNPKARSHKGAVGLFQLKTETAKELLPKLWGHLDVHDPLRRLSVERLLHDVRTSTLLGALYLKILLQRFEGDLSQALAAYNVGPRKMEEALDRGVLLRKSYIQKIFDLTDRI